MLSIQIYYVDNAYVDNVGTENRMIKEFSVKIHLCGWKKTQKGRD